MSDLDRQLCDAAKAGDLNRIRDLLEQGARVAANCKSNDGWTLLHLASLHGHENVVSILIERGAQIESRTGYGMTPLHIAAANGRAEVVRILIERGAQIETRDCDGETPLHLAARGNEKAVHVLLERGAQIEVKNRNEETPLDLAQQQKHSTVERLLNEAIAKAQNETASTSAPITPSPEFGDRIESNNSSIPFPEFEDLGRLITSRQELCDCTILVENEKIRAHKLVLSKRSPYFRNVFVKGRQSAVTIDRLGLQTIRSIVDFCYSGKQEDLVGSDEELLEAASYFRIDALKDYYEEKLCLSVTKTNANARLRLAEKCDAYALIRKCLTSIISDPTGTSNEAVKKLAIIFTGTNSQFS